MPSRDGASIKKTVPVINPGTATSDNTAIVSAIVDMAGFQKCTFVIQSGTLADADATFATTIAHGDASNLSDAAAPSADDLIGTLAAASFTFSEDGVAKKLGYVGDKRYARLTITPTGNSGSAPFSAVAILEDGPVAPVA